MDLTYRPYIRDSYFNNNIDIRNPSINIEGYKPHYTVTTKTDDKDDQQKDNETATPVESQVEEVREQYNPSTRARSTNKSSFSSKKEFLDVMTPIYENLLAQKGLNPIFAKALVAQDGLESA